MLNDREIDAAILDTVNKVLEIVKGKAEMLTKMLNDSPEAKGVIPSLQSAKNLYNKNYYTKCILTVACKMISLDLNVIEMVGQVHHSERIL